MFHTIADLLAVDPKPIAQTPMGRHILEMTEYFMDKTKGRVPVSMTDIQAPVNMLSYLLPITDLFMEVYDDPEGLAEASMLVADLLAEFLEKQRSIIGDALAAPGHGFASSHSCGNWEKKIPMVKKMNGIIMADGAFTQQTDPSPNTPEIFRDAFTNSGIILNARAVGPDAEETFSRLYQKGMKLIAVTYCETAEEQTRLYRKLHEMETRE